MIINLEEILENGLSLNLVVKPENFPTLVEMNETGEFNFRKPITIDLEINKIKEFIEVNGNFQTDVGFTCSRCLNEFQSVMKDAFSITYTKNLPEYADDFSDEGRELLSEEMGLVLFKGNKIDLRDAIQEQIVLAVPLKTLCSEECKGLCSKCGKDLNRKECTCENENIDIRLAVLKNFKPSN